MLPVFIVGALAVAIGREVEITALGLGLSVSGYYGASMLTAIPGGYLSDRFGPARLLRIGLAGSVAALLGLGAIATSWVQISIFLLIAGCANGLSQPAANLALVRGVINSRRGWAFGLKQSSVPLAALLAGASVPSIGVTLGWRWAFVVGAIIAAFVIVFVRTSPRGTTFKPEPSRHQTAQLVVYGIVGALGSASANSLAVFIVPWAVQNGFEIGTAGTLLSVASLSTIAMRLLMGRLIDRKPSISYYLVSALMIFGSLGYFALASLANLAPFLVAGALVAFGAGWGWTGLLIFGVASEFQAVAGRATGVLQSITFAGGMIGPFLFGLAIENLGYKESWLIAGGITALAATVLFFGKSPSRRTNA